MLRETLLQKDLKTIRRLGMVLLTNVSSELTVKMELLKMSQLVGAKQTTKSISGLASLEVTDKLKESQTTTLHGMGQSTNALLICSIMKNLFSLLHPGGVNKTTSITTGAATERLIQLLLDLAIIRVPGMEQLTNASTPLTVQLKDQSPMFLLIGANKTTKITPGLVSLREMLLVLVPWTTRAPGMELSTSALKCCSPNKLVLFLHGGASKTTSTTTGLAMAKLTLLLQDLLTIRVLGMVPLTGASVQATAPMELS